jgi:hypothetical protein
MTLAAFWREHLSYWLLIAAMIGAGLASIFLLLAGAMRIIELVTK